VLIRAFIFILAFATTNNAERVAERKKSNFFTSAIQRNHLVEDDNTNYSIHGLE
jgi:hypothetical protein